MSSISDQDEVERLREYLRIPSVHPDIDYSECVNFLKKQAKLLDLPVSVYEFVPKKPIVVITCVGSQPELPSILLNSHMDVVPVSLEHWTYPPFDATVTEDGWLYARGSQDMKSVGMMHLEVVRRVKSAGVLLKRTVHLSFVPDEEIGSDDGMKLFAESQQFRDLNIGFGLDEGMPSSTTGSLVAFHGERTSRQIKVTCLGSVGHGSTLTNNTAGEKLYYIIDKFMKLREEEKKKYDSGVPLGEVITINITQIEGGVQINVLPAKLSVSIDIRIPPHIDHQEFENKILTWCKEAGEGVTFEYYVKNPEVKATKIDGSIPFWTKLEQTLNDLGIKVHSVICPGATDARFVRKQGIPSINLTPMFNTPLLFHDHDERILVEEYKKGINVMQAIVTAVANL